MLINANNANDQSVIGGMWGGVVWGNIALSCSHIGRSHQITYEIESLVEHLDNLNKNIVTRFFIVV